MLYPAVSFSVMRFLCLFSVVDTPCLLLTFRSDGSFESGRKRDSLLSTSAPFARCPLKLFTLLVSFTCLSRMFEAPFLCWRCSKEESNVGGLKDACDALKIRYG